MSDDFQRVKDAINLADYVGRYSPLKRAGTVLQCSCPLPGHNDKSPSFQVKDDHWICRGKCGVGGDIFDFAERYHGWTKQEALEELARYAGITLEPLSPEHKAKQDKRERLYALMEEACTYYQGQLFLAQGSEALSYLMDERGLSHETIVSARLGYSVLSYDDIIRHLTRQGYSYHEMLQSRIIACKDKDETTVWDFFRNRVMIPIRDHKGRIVAFSGRAMDKKDEPKYLHNANNATTGIFEKSKIIHTMPLNQSTIGFKAFDTIVMVEGSIDPVSALNCGVYNVVSLLGKSLSDEQLTLLCKTGAKRLVFCLDKDDAGRKALRNLTEKHITRLASQGIELFAMFAPHGKDPDDTFREMPHLWQPAVDAAQSVVNVLIDLEMAKLGDHPAAAHVSAMINDLLPILKSTNPLIEDENIGILAHKTGVAFDRLKGWLAPQMHVMDKPIPAPKQETLGTPTSEEWVLHGILCNEFDDWLARANACLFIASHAPMPYALAPLALEDFTDQGTRRLMDLILKSQVARETFADYLGEHVERGLQAAYKRVVDLDDIGKEFLMPFNYDIFVHYVCEVRITRLSREHVAFEGKDAAKARECSRAIACLRLSQQDLIDA